MMDDSTATPAAGGPSKPPIAKITLAKKLRAFSTYWDPKVIGSLNGQHVRLAKLKGSFVWHAHEHADELFLVLEGTMRMLLPGQELTLEPGEMVIIPRGIRHCPTADDEVSVLLFEPADTVNTGDAGGDRTVAHLEEI